MSAAPEASSAGSGPCLRVFSHARQGRRGAAPARYQRAVRAEIRLVAVAEGMTREAMHARVAAEAGRRGIERVARIEEEATAEGSADAS